MLAKVKMRIDRFDCTLKWSFIIQFSQLEDENLFSIFSSSLSLSLALNRLSLKHKRKLLYREAKLSLLYSVAECHCCSLLKLAAASDL